MKSQVILISVLIFTSWVTPSFSGTLTSHLQPEEGLFGFTMLNPYYEAVSERLLSSSNSRKCQAVFLPSFSQESAVYLKYNEDKPKMAPLVVTLKLEQQLWFEMQKLMEANADEKGSYYTDAKAQRKVIPKIDSVVNRFEAPIKTKVAIALEQVWEAMLLQSHYHELTGRGLDGETYHFANFTPGFGYKAGKVWSPRKGTVSYDLVELAKALRDYPTLDEESRNDATEDMFNRAQRLQAILQGYEQKTPPTERDSK